MLKIDFNPRPPCGGRREADRKLGQDIEISTHALLAEGDRWRDNPLRRADSYFNPRPPCGGRQVVRRVQMQSVIISTHALLAEGDPTASATL